MSRVEGSRRISAQASADASRSVRILATGNGYGFFALDRVHILPVSPETAAEYPLQETARGRDERHGT